jgi:hypothetical protein
MIALESLAKLINQRNRINTEISQLIGRPASSGHIGKYIASKIFNVQLRKSASIKGFDGVFTDGDIKGKTVNIKLYSQLENILTINPLSLADYCLVLTGPKSTTLSSRGKTRPLVIRRAYLFDMPILVEALNRRGVKIGIATSVANQFWESAEIFPLNVSSLLILSQEQRRLLRLFSDQNPST